MNDLKRQAVNGVMWKLGNSLCTTGVTFVVSVILARLLSPSDYGMLAMIAVFTVFLQIFTDGGLTTALVRKEDRTETDMATVFWYNLFACYAVYAVLFIAAPYVEAFYAMKGLGTVMRVTTSSLLISPFGGMQSMLMTTRIDFKTPAFISVGASLASGAVAVAMAFLGYGVWALVAQGLVSSVVTVVSLVMLVRWYPKSFFNRKAFKELFGFSSKMLLSQILTTVYAKIAPLFIGKYYSPADLGALERGRGWAFLPGDTLTKTIGAVSFPVLSKVQDDTALLRDAYRKMIRLSSFIVFPMCLGLASIGRPLTLFVLTDKWECSIPFLYVYCYIAMWMPMNSLNLNLLLVKGRSDLTLRLEILKKTIGFSMLAVTLPLGLWYFCAGDLICASGIFLVMNLYYTGKILDWGVLRQLRDVTPYLLNALCMVGVSLGVQMLCETNLTKVLVAIPSAVMYYMITSYVFFKGVASELLNMLRRR